MKNGSTARKLKFLHTIFALERDLIVGGQAVMEGVMMRTPSAYAIACRRSDGSIVHTAASLPKWSDTYKWLSWPVLRGGATLIQSMALGVKALNFSAKVWEEDHEAQKEMTTEAVAETEAALVDGTLDENFTKARVKVTMPAETKAKKAGQSATAVGSIIFGLVFNIVLFLAAPLLLTNLAFIGLHWADGPVIADGAGWFATIKAYIWEIKPHSWIAFNLADGMVRMVFFVIIDRKSVV